MAGANVLPTPVPILRDLPPESRLLIVRLRSIGDIVLMTPALRLLKQWRSDLRISVLVESRFAPLIAANPDIDETIPLDRERAGDLSWRTRLRRVKEIRRGGFAASINLHGGPTSALLTGASRARWRVGFAHYPNRFLYNLRIPDARGILGQEVVHTAEHQASAFFWMGLPRQEVPSPRLVIRPEWKESVTLRIKQLGLSPEKPYAVVQPTALFATKQWAPEKFARVGEYLERDKALEVIYTCGPGESSTLDAVEQSIKQSKNQSIEQAMKQATPHSIGQATRRPVGRLENLEMGELVALLAGAKIFVGNDSGPAHIAGALGLPVVVIFGSSNSRIWRPWRAAAHIVQNSYPCNPCPGDRCYQFPEPECILSVTEDQVRQAVDAALAQTAALSRSAQE